QTPGLIGFAAAANPGSFVTSTTGGSVLSVNFHVKSNAPPGNSTIAFIHVQDSSFHPSTGATPAAPNGGAYTLNASDQINGVISVHGMPVFTSGNSSTFSVGVAGSATVTASGLPAPTLS